VRPSLPAAIPRGTALHKGMASQERAVSRKNTLISLQEKESCHTGLLTGLTRFVLTNDQFSAMVVGSVMRRQRSVVLDLFTTKWNYIANGNGSQHRREARLYD
jgi:hypothetical protein